MDARRSLGVDEGNGDICQEPQCEEALLSVRKAIILEREGGAFEHPGSIDEVQTMVPQVRTPLLLVPRESHRHSVYTPRLCVNVRTFALTTYLSGRARCLGRGKTRPTLAHDPLERVVSSHCRPRQYPGRRR